MNDAICVVHRELQKAPFESCSRSDAASESPPFPVAAGRAPTLSRGPFSKQLLLLMIVVELPSNCTCREFGVVNVYVVLIRVLDDVVNQVTAHIGRASPHRGDRVR